MFDRDQNSRQLLMGLLALQQNLVSLDALIAAMDQWRQDTSQNLAAVFIEYGLRPDDYDRLHSLIQQRSVAPDRQQRLNLPTLRATEPPLERATDLEDTDLEDLVSTASGTGNYQSTHDVAAGRRIDHGATTVQRYRILRPHAKGGLGEVFVARDLELNREVAVKEIRRQYADHPDSRTRFVLEAEITGGLEHPGIVPVYGLGQYGDGRPFYAMRFIRGSSLNEAIKLFHAAGSKVWTSGDALLKLRELLRRFSDVCHAVEYAHSRGVLHRDLKPGNVMLGNYGETLVVDWGLAKVFGQSGNAVISKTEQSLFPSSLGAASATRMGQAVGTAAFMSPEQAAGQLDQLGPASDVYSLGATLYCLLTGRPAFVDQQPDRVLAQVREGDFPAPRAVQPLVPRPLESICLRAMSLQPEARYSSPRELVDDLNRWLADESVEAHQESLGERLSRLGRRYKAAVRAAAAALLLVATVATVAALMINHQRNRAETLADANGRLALSERGAKENAQRAAERNQRVLGYMVAAFRRPDPSIEGDKVTVASVLDQSMRAASQQLATDPVELASVLDHIGETFRGLGLYARSVEAYGRAVEVRRAHFGPDERETLTSMNNLAVAYQAADRPDKALALFERVLERSRAVFGADDPDTLNSMHNVAACYAAAKRLDEALALHLKALELKRAKLGEDHIETLYSIEGLADTYHSLHRYDESLRLHELAYDVLRAKGMDDHPTTILTMVGLATAHQSLGKLDQARSLAEESVSLAMRRLGPDHPTTFAATRALVKSYRSAGEVDKALPLAETTLERMRMSLGETHDETMKMTSLLTAIYEAADEFEKGLPLAERDLELTRRRWGETDPSTLITMNNLAAMRLAAGKLDEANSLASLTLEMTRARLGEENPQTAFVMHNLALCHLSRLQFDEAIELLKRTLQVREITLGKDHPETLMSVGWLCGAYMETRRFQLAEPLARRWVRFWEAAIVPEKKDFARSKTYLAEALLELGRLDEAREQVQAALALDETDRAKNLLGGVLAKQHAWSEAEPLLLQSYEALKSDLPTWRVYLRWYVSRACERIIAMYEAQGKTDEVAKWRQELESVNVEIERLRGPQPANASE